MNAHGKLVPMDDAHTAGTADAERVGLLDALHWLGDLKDADTIVVCIPVDDDGEECTVEIEKSAASADLLALLAGYLTAKAARLEAEIRDIGIAPSAWTAPGDGEHGDDAGVGASDTPGPVNRLM